MYSGRTYNKARVHDNEDDETQSFFPSQALVSISRRSCVGCACAVGALFGVLILTTLLVTSRQSSRAPVAIIQRNKASTLPRTSKPLMISKHHPGKPKGDVGIADMECMQEVLTVAMQALCNPGSAFSKAAPETFNATFDTTEGSFVIAVSRSDAPVSVDRFYGLVQSGFYDNTVFYRNLPHFIVQFGPSAIPALNRLYQNNCKGFGSDWAPCSTTGGCFWIDRVHRTNGKATVAFSTDTAEEVCSCSKAPEALCAERSNSSVLVAGSELFINLADNPYLDGLGFAPFGAVVEGMSTVLALAATGEMDTSTKPHTQADLACDQQNSSQKIRLGCVYSQGTTYTHKFPALSRIHTASVTSDGMQQ